MFMIGMGPSRGGEVRGSGEAHSVSDTNFEKAMSWSFVRIWKIRLEDFIKVNLLKRLKIRQRQEFPSHS